MNQPHEIIEPGVLAVLSRSEIDGQIAKAEHRPRSIELFREKTLTIATFSEESAAECLYTLPARGSGKEPIEGPSVRFAEILVSAYGNCRVGARVIEEAATHVTAQGIFHDLESNAVTTFEVRRKIVDRTGRRYSLDMVNMTANAACSIARRNAVLQAIPKPLWFDLYKQARQVSAGDEKKLPEKVEQAINAFSKLGIDTKRLFASIAVESRDDIDADKLAQLRGTFQAIKDGEFTLEEAFPAPEPARKKTSVDDFKTMKSSSRTPAPPDVASAADAYDLGQQARRDNIKREGWPGAWRDQINIDAFLSGWDAEDEYVRMGGAGVPPISDDGSKWDGRK